MKVLLSKNKENGDIEFAPVDFNSSTKTVINFDKYDANKSYQEILYQIDNWLIKDCYQEFHTLNCLVDQETQ